MTIPNLPTDNLYKFIALSGLCICLFTFVYPTYLFTEVEKRLSDVKTEIGKFNIEYNKIDSEQKELLTSLESLEKNLNEIVPKENELVRISLDELKEKIKDKNYREYIKFLREYKEDLVPEYKKFKELVKKKDKLFELQHQHKIKAFEISRANEIARDLINRNYRLSLILIIGQLIGGLVTIAGFRLWYTKVQKILDLKLLKELNK